LDSECGRYWFLSDFCRWKFKINSKKPGFERKKSVEDVVTLGPTAQATLVIFDDIFSSINNKSDTWINRGGWLMMRKSTCC